MKFLKWMKWPWWLLRTMNVFILVALVLLTVMSPVAGMKAFFSVRHNFKDSAAFVKNPDKMFATVHVGTGRGGLQVRVVANPSMPEGKRFRMKFEQATSQISFFPTNKPMLNINMGDWKRVDEGVDWRPMTCTQYLSLTHMLEEKGVVNRFTPIRSVTLPLYIVMPIWVLATLFGELSTIQTLRRWRWTRQNRCISCGYDLRGLKQCPECGVENKSAKTATS